MIPVLLEDSGEPCLSGSMISMGDHKVLLDLVVENY